MKSYLIKANHHWCQVLYLTLVFVLILFSAGACQAADVNSLEARTLNIPFIANAGQWNDEAVFLTTTLAGSLYVTRQGEIVHIIPGMAADEKKPPVVVRESLVGSNQACPRGEHKTGTSISIYNGQDLENWKSGIAAYQSIVMEDIYPGISLELASRQGLAEKMFHVAPAADVKMICLQISEGTLKLDGSGALLINTPYGCVKLSAPYAYQEINGRRIAVQVAYQILDHNCYGFSVADYDPAQELVIDPVLYATFAGGSDSDTINRMVVDSSDNIYVAGNTCSMDFPMVNNPYQGSLANGTDIFVARFSSDLSTLLAVTFIGGNGDENAAQIMIAGDGDIVVSGGSSSNDFPVTAGAYEQTPSGSQDAFICRLSADLSTLEASTYYGGSDDDYATSAVMGLTGDIYISGTTGSGDLPMQDDGYNTALSGDKDVFIAALSGDLQNLKAATYFGDAETDEGLALGIDSSGKIYVAGTFDKIYKQTAYNTYYCDHVGLGKFNPGLSAVEASNFFRYPEGTSTCEAMTVVPTGDVYVAYHSNDGYWRENIRLFSPELVGQAEKQMEKLSPYDTVPHVSALGLANGYLYVAGNARQGDDPGFAYIMNMEPSLNQVMTINYLKYSNHDQINCIDFDSSGRVYAAGFTNSSDFLVGDHAYDNQLNNGELPDANDGFIVIYDVELQPEVNTDLSITQNTGAGEISSGDTLQLNIAVNNNGSEGPASGRVDTVISPAAGMANISVTAAGGDSYSVNGNQVTIYMNNIASGQERQAVIDIATPDAFSGPLQMLSSVSLLGGNDSNTANNQAETVSVAVNPAGQSSCDVWADIQNTASGENQWLHSITFGNHGPSPAADVFISYFLPAQVDFVSAQPDGYTYDATTHTVSWSRDTVQSGYQSDESGDDYKVESKLKESENPDNVLESLIKVLTSTPDSDSTNNEKKVSFNGQYNCQFKLTGQTKSDRDDDTIYRLCITNTGDMPIKTSIAFPIPEGLSYKSYESNDLYHNPRGSAHEAGGCIQWQDTTPLQPDSTVYLNMVFAKISWNEHKDYKIEAAATLNVEGHPELRRTQTMVTNICRPDRLVSSGGINQIITRGQEKQTLRVGVDVYNNSKAKLKPIDVKVNISGGAEGKVKLAKVETGEALPAASITGDRSCEWRIPAIYPNDHLLNHSIAYLCLDIGPLSEGQSLSSLMSDIVVNVETAFAPEYNEYEQHEINRDNNKGVIKIHLVEITLQKQGTITYDPIKCLMQHTFLTKYNYNNTNPMPPNIGKYLITDSFPDITAIQTVTNQTRPSLTAQVSELAPRVAYQSAGGLSSGRAGTIKTNFASKPGDFPFGQDIRVNTEVKFELDNFWYERTFTNKYKLELPVPTISTPESGEMCHLSKSVAVGGFGLPGAQIRFYNALTDELIPVNNVISDDKGTFLASIPANQHYIDNHKAGLTFYITQVVNGQESGPSAVVELVEPSHCWCPQRSYWEGRVGEKKFTFKFRNRSTGRLSTTNWQIPGKYGFWDTTLHLYVCCDKPCEVKVIADGREYYPVGQEGHYYLFNINYAHKVQIVVDCEEGEAQGKQKESSGTVLIDPDGYVFDIKQGMDHVVPGARVTCMAYDEINQSWAQWPAHLYENQVNPQVVGNDGYFAFFTPPGRYYLQAENPAPYQSWRSPDILVVNEIVHQNIPYTAAWAGNEVYSLLVSTDGIRNGNGENCAQVTINTGDIIEWTAVPSENITEQMEHPTIRVLSSLDPAGDTRAFDSGLLEPLALYRYRFDHSGTYEYSYLQGDATRKATIIVTGSPVPGSSSSGGSSSPSAVHSKNGTAILYPAAGGSVGIDELIAVSIPAGALQGNNPLKVELHSVDTPPVPPSGFLFLGKVYELTVAGQASYQFNHSCTLTFAFEPDQTPAGQAPEIYFFDEVRGEWVNLGGSINGDKISINIDHFTRFAVMARAAEAENEPEKIQSFVFPDIDGHWAQESIEKLLGLNIISGYEDGCFKPDRMISRAEFVAILIQALGLQVQEDKVFADTKNHWAREAISTAVANKIVNGYSKEKFAPDEPITREQMAVMTAQAARLTAADGKVFSDNHQISAWAREAVAKTSAAGIISGYPDRSFKPQNHASRAEASIIIVKTMTY